MQRIDPRPVVPDRRQWRRRSPLAIGVGIALLVGCPAPIPYTVTQSSAMVGSLEWADGTPAAGVVVAVSHASSTQPCASPTAHATTDSAGMFRFAAVEQRYNTTWIVPGLDPVSPGFRLCAALRDTLLPAYLGQGSLRGQVPPDSVRCVAWEWMSEPRVSCAGRATHSVVTGGRWTADGAVGVYRLFLAPPAPWGGESAYLQWLEPAVASDPATSAHRFRVRATVRLDVDSASIRYLHNMFFWRRDGRWLASLGESNPSVKAGPPEVVFELGAPGRVSRVAAP